jgi:hypothetical protein
MTYDPTWVTESDLNDQIQTIIYTSPLSGITDNKFPIIGTLREVGTGQTGEVNTNFAVANQHVYIYVNSITTGGDLIITGTSLSESTAVPVTNNTETITLDTSANQYYQSSKKWWEVDSISISGGTIAGINYDYGIVGYPDLGNRNFKIVGYRADIYSQNDSADIRILLQKIQDDGNKKMSVITLEDIGVNSGDAGDQIIDGLRTGANDRSYNPSATYLWANNTSITLKQGDFDTYFTNDENIFESSSKDEGYVIYLGGSPAGGITGADFISIEIFYKTL